MSDQPAPDPKPNLTPWAIWIPIIVAVLGIVVFYNYLLAMKQQAASEEKDRPAILGRLEDDLTLTERTGKTVHLNDLRGKIILASWVYTRCPRGCAGVIAKLKKLQEEYRGNPNIHFVSFTLDPDDTPEMMAQFASGIDVKETDPWWFVQGDKEEVRSYLTQFLKFRPVQDLPEKDRLSPDDKYIHDLRVALVDHQGHLRGTLYDLMNADPQFAEHFDEQLRKDLNFILKEKQKDNEQAP
ncbi:SCO family protein [Prosthecobacter sp. SYSU 5D2]|uniref:SCO family protein n=1 Tax=Prosthecobacter sp. SYSU 5D2 TaxID=3134134 RepID=UPI0031FEF6C1